MASTTRLHAALLALFSGGRRCSQTGFAVFLVACGPSITVVESSADTSTTSTQVDSSSGGFESEGSPSSGTSLSGTTLVSVGSSSSGGTSSTGGFTTVLDATGPVYFACVPTDSDCLNGVCAPWDAQGLGHWSARTCFYPDVRKAKEPGDTCFMPEGPLLDQDNCGEGLVCLGATEDSTEGVCARIDPNPDNCEHFCNEVTLFLCLEELGCPEAGDFCAATGCG